MRKKMTTLVTLALVLGSVCTGYAGSIVLGDFEDGLDSWTVRDGFTLTPGATGATSGAQALQVDGPGGWKQGAHKDLKPFMAEMATPGVKLSVDLTVFSEDITSTWMNFELVINGQNNDNNGANNNIGFNQLGQQGVTRDGESHTYTWELPDDLVLKLGGVDDTIAWYQLVLISNLDGASVVKYYIDNIQLITPGSDDDGSSSTDVIVGNWENDLDGWEVLANADTLFNDHNGVTLGDYSLDVYIAKENNSGWTQDVLKLDVIQAGLLDAIKGNTKFSVDVTRLVADWPTEPEPGWNEIVLVINAGGDGFDNFYKTIGKKASWKQSDGDKTITATYDYGAYLPEMNYLEGVTWFEFLLFVNIDQGTYDNYIWYYLDNARLSGGGKAVGPKPDDGAKDVLTDASLSWKSGAFTDSHHLYLGTNLSAVFAAEQDSDPNVTFTVLDINSFDPNTMEFKTDYFWRVDEVNETHPDSPWKGNVWKFTTADFIAIDNFEGYTDFEPDRIFDTWSDGYEDDKNGSTAGNLIEPFAETNTVLNGAQALPMYFNNAGEAEKSEIMRSWDEPQDWTLDGLNAYEIVLSTYGSSANVPGELYLIIEDSTGASHTMTNTGADVFTTMEWTEWSLPMEDIVKAGVNLASVSKLTIGVADLAGQKEANGKLIIDDILAYPPALLKLEPDLLIVNKTDGAPVIDGIADEMWNDVNATSMLITDIVNTDSETPEDANDLYATFKTTFDDTHFYLFVEVQDSVLDAGDSSWKGDGIEVYFDGDYSHGDSYDGVNDNQIRITVDDVDLSGLQTSVPIEGTTFKVLLTDVGYNIEAAFPLDVLQIVPTADPEPLIAPDGTPIPNTDIAPNNIIGFEMQINDNDGNDRETLMRWHSDDNNSWDKPNLFGQARLMGAGQ